MTLLLGLFLIPFVLLIIQKSNKLTATKKTKILLNISLILISIIYIILCWIIKAEPFNFEEHYSVEYMIFNGEYLLYSGLIVMFTPFIWIIFVHFIKMIFKAIRVRKNAIIKREDDYIYYRGDLDKISPSIIMFTSIFDLDMKKSIASTILKLKLTGYIEEKNNSLIYTNKDKEGLLDSEKMILDYIKTNTFDKNLYKQTIEKETLKNKYITKNHGGIFGRILKIIIAICVPFIIFNISVKLDDYVFDYYHVWPEKDGHSYILLKKSKDIADLHKEVKDENDYYHREMADGSISYSYDEIRADKLQYGVVRKTFGLVILTTFIIGFFSIFVLISLYVVISQIVNINKNYTRTIKGKQLLNKAYALKNYLKDYSLIKQRTEKELVLWEYYLVYAVALDVNEDIEDNIIQKYIKNI